MSVSQKVAILGASDKIGRYAYKAFSLLRQKDHQVYPINPRLQSIESIKVYPSLNDLDIEIDTLTLYLSPQRLEPLVEDILKLKPKRVIFNPGSESKLVQEKLTEAGIFYEEACTLVLLSTGQFDLLE